ncbi:MAG: ChaN family lipoprotein, partial [Deltaproteobacteria bacterium]|nr:ChaN family lipoprotein [Deltaproteobacteria bacterium]
SYQQILYLWSDGELNEKEFMEKMHWYANWRFDFELYKDILLFLKNNRIRIVGLNLPFHIPPKIAIGGIESLSDDEKKNLPKEIDTSNVGHKAYLEKIFEEHKVKGREKFENFYMAQCVWEEMMAESISQNLKGNPMIVLVGNGHIVHKFGIPDRAFRRTEASFKTIFLAPAGSGAEAELSFADYIWVTPSINKHHMGRRPHGHR